MPTGALKPKSRAEYLPFRTMPGQSILGRAGLSAHRHTLVQTLARSYKRVEIARLKEETLLINGKQCCTKFFMAVFGVSMTYIYGDNRRIPRQRMAPVAEAIITFFKQMRLENDAMPDKMEYQLYAMKKKEVFRWYDNTAQEHQKCSISYFYVQWAEHASDCKLRRCLRFAKCQECQDLRQVG